MVRHYAPTVWGSYGEDLVLLDVRRRRLGIVTFLEASFFESRRLCWWWSLAGAVADYVVVKVLRVHGCYRALAGVQVAVVISGTAGRGGALLRP
jgi:hypothetical protein